MSQCSDIRIRATWSSGDCQHREDHFFQAVDIGQGADSGHQDKLCTTDIIPPYDPEKRVSLERPSVPSARSLATGRYYHTDLLLPASDTLPKYSRLIDLNDSHITLDFNHPLVNTEIQIDVSHLDVYEGNTSRTHSDCLHLMLNDGPGMQRCDDMPEYVIDSDTTRRIDEADDAEHYREPDFEDTFDRIGGKILADTYAEFLQPGMQLLDIMCGAQSYLPADIKQLQTTGIGLNSAELQANLQLSDFMVHNVNKNRQLPFADNSFDAILFTAAVEYLVDPHTTFRELHRVTRAGGVIVVSFTDHWNTCKNISLWQELPQFERLRLVLDYLRKGGNISNPGTITVRGQKRSVEDRHSPERTQADPVFISYARVDKA